MIAPLIVIPNLDLLSNEDKIISKLNEIIDQINGWQPTALDTKQEKCPACHNILSVKEGRNTCVQCGRTGTMGDK